LISVPFWKLEISFGLTALEREAGFIASSNDPEVGGLTMFFLAFMRCSHIKSLFDLTLASAPAFDYIGIPMRSEFGPKMFF
jgi:hypothetical protein